MLIYIYVGLYIYIQTFPFVYIQNPSLFSWSLIPSSLHPDAAVEAEAWTQIAWIFCGWKMLCIYIHTYTSEKILYVYIYIHILYILYTILYCSNNSNIITQSFEKITLPIRIHLNQFKLIPPLGKIQVCVCALRWLTSPPPKKKN